MARSLNSIELLQYESTQAASSYHVWNSSHANTRPNSDTGVWDILQFRLAFCVHLSRSLRGFVMGSILTVVRGGLGGNGSLPMPRPFWLPTDCPSASEGPGSLACVEQPLIRFLLASEHGLRLLQPTPPLR